MIVRKPVAGTILLGLLCTSALIAAGSSTTQCHGQQLTVEEVNDEILRENGPDLSGRFGTERTQERAGISGINEFEAPNAMLYRWFYLSELAPIESLVSANDETLSRLHRGAKVFDCTRFKMDSRLREALSDAHSLEWLRIGKQALPSDLDWICRLKKLKALDLSDCDLSESDFWQLKELQDLRWLGLQRTILPSKDTFQNKCIELDELEVLLCVLPEDGWLNACLHCPKLKVLHLNFSSKITDAEIEYAANAFPNLRYLSLPYCGITKEAASSIKKMKKLEFGYLGLTAFASSPNLDTLIKELKKSLPESEFDFGD